ncbi:hypothetical protein PENSPDRAFT_433019 [Peniophora sp. CONT]|nr:hypothetical protein PENSPDRAFT_433019 [Peniophora sp. CONT]
MSRVRRYHTVSAGGSSVQSLGVYERLHITLWSSSIIAMSVQRPTSDFKLPSELWLIIFDLVFADYLEGSGNEGKEYLPHHIVLPSAPWNVISIVCRRSREIVRSHSAHVTMLRPDLTSAALSGRSDRAPLHLYYTDIDNWTWFRNSRRTSDFDIPSALELALAAIPKTKTFTIFSTAADTSEYHTPMPFRSRTLSKAQKVKALSDIFKALATVPAPDLQELRVFAFRDRYMGDVDEGIMREGVDRFWTNAAQVLPDLRRLTLSGILCTTTPHLPPSLTELNLSCAFTTSMEDILAMLSHLPRLRDLSLSSYAHDLPSLFSDRQIRRCVHLPHLEKLALQEKLPAITAVLFHIDFSPITSLSLMNTGWCFSSNAEEAIAALACEVQSHLESNSPDDTPAFEFAEINLWRQVDAFDLHAKAGGQTLDVWLDWTRAEARCDGLRIFLEKVGELHSVVNLSLSPGIYRSYENWDERLPFRMHQTFACLRDVEELRVQMRLTKHVCDVLTGMDQFGEPSVFPILQEFTIADEQQLDPSRVVNALVPRVAWRAGVLCQVVFVSCPRLSGCSDDQLAWAFGGISIDLSQVDKDSGHAIEELQEETEPDDDDWSLDSDSNSDYEESWFHDEPTAGIPIPN